MPFIFYIYNYEKNNSFPGPALYQRTGIQSAEQGTATDQTDFLFLSEILPEERSRF